MRLKSQHWQPEFHSWSPAATCSLWTFMFGENDKQLKAQSYLPTGVLIFVLLIFFNQK